MQTIFRKATLFSLGAAALVLSGCASTDDVKKAQSTADQAQSTAQQAQQTANEALSTAKAAEQKADQNSAEINQLQQNMQAPHRGPRG